MIKSRYGCMGHILYIAPDKFKYSSGILTEGAHKRGPCTLQLMIDIFRKKSQRALTKNLWHFSLLCFAKFDLQLTAEPRRTHSVVSSSLGNTFEVGHVVVSVVLLPPCCIWRLFN